MFASVNAEQIHHNDSDHIIVLDGGSGGVDDVAGSVNGHDDDVDI